MRLHYLSAELSELDRATGEIIACAIWEDERPLRGVAGLLDWRLTGKLSSLAKAGFLTGARGEVFLLPVRPRLPFDKLVIFGLGPRRDLDEAEYRAALAEAKRTLQGLQAHRALIELPGRGSNAIDAEVASRAALEPNGNSAIQDEWWVIEPPGTRAILQEMIEREHRARRTI